MSLAQQGMPSTRKTSSRKSPTNNNDQDKEIVIRPARVRIAASPKEGRVPLLGKVGGGRLSAAAMRVPIVTAKGRAIVEKKRS